MPKYKYNAVTIDGKEVKGRIINATNEVTALSLLRADGYFPSKLDEVKDGSIELWPAKVKPQAMAGFCNQMAAMIRAGVSISAILEILRDQAEDKVMKRIMPDIFSEVHKGASLSEAIKPFEKHFPNYFLSMVEAGEVSGSLDKCIERAAVSFTSQSKLSSKVKSAMIYPIAIFVILIAVTFLLMLFVVPEFAAVYEDIGADLPMITQVVMGISNFLVTRWYFVLAAAVAVVGGFLYWKRTEGGATKFGLFVLRIPKVGKLVQKIHAARFAESLASLTSTGISIPQAIEITSRSITNKYVESGLSKAVDALKRGETLSSQLKKMDVFPPLLVYVVKTGEESGTMEELLNKTSDFYNDEADAAVSAMLALLQPLLIVLMALMVLPVLLAIVTPMFGIYMEMM